MLTFSAIGEQKYFFLVHFQEEEKYGLGLYLIFSSRILDTKDTTKKSKFREKATEYMNRAEALQKIIDSKKKEGSFHEFQKIAENSIGNSYMSLFGRFLDTDVFTITVEDPYIRAHHQIINFLRFVEKNGRVVVFTNVRELFE